MDVPATGWALPSEGHLPRHDHTSALPGNAGFWVAAGHLPWVYLTLLWRSFVLNLKKADDKHTSVKILFFRQMACISSLPIPECTHSIQTCHCCLWGLTGFSYSLDRRNKDLTESFPAHTILVEHAPGQICFMGCRKGTSLWLTALLGHTQREPSSRGTATTTLLSTKAETRVELVWELDKERLSICILCRLYKLIASAEAWRWISWSMLCLACTNARRCIKVQGPHLLRQYLYFLSSQGTPRS